MSYFNNNDDFDPPDGHYQVEIQDASAFTGQDGREWAKVVLQVTDGEHKGRIFDHFMNLNHPVGLQFAQEALVGYGIDTEEVENFGDLQAAMPDLLGTQASVTVGHKNNFRNTTVLSTVTGQSDIPDVHPGQESFAAQASSSTNNSPDDDSDIPF